MIEIKPQKTRDCDIVVPGSKSYTHRILIASALADGSSCIENALKSEDTLLTLNALKQMGTRVEASGNQLHIDGSGGRFKACNEPIYLGNSGTSMRLLCALTALGQGKYTLTGTERMAERPIQDLLDSLDQIGVYAVSTRKNGCPPIEVTGGEIEGGALSVRCHISSQFLSALLLIAPCTRRGLDITVTEGPVSKPYIDMTVNIMKRFGIQISRKGYNYFSIPGQQRYQAGQYAVEPDCSQASYFWAAAAVTGSRIKVLGISKDTRQGDVRFADVLNSMGCTVTYEDDGIAVAGGELSGVEVDMADMPDIVPTLAVVAAFAKGTTVIKNVPHLKAKESDRLGAVASELQKLAIDARATDTGLIIKGTADRAIASHRDPASKITIETYDDHRIAMSFAVAGLMIPGVMIKNEQCVEKSFPTFWETFEGLYHE